MNPSMIQGIVIGVVATLIVDHVIARMARAMYHAGRNMFAWTPIVMLIIGGIVAFVLTR